MTLFPNLDRSCCGVGRIGWALRSMRQVGAPKGTHWVPITTYLMTFLDMMNALIPTPGTFAQGGHDYRAVLPKALRDTWRLEASDVQMERVNQALRQRELAWELYRDWAAANVKSAQDVDKAREKVAQRCNAICRVPGE